MDICKFCQRESCACLGCRCPVCRCPIWIDESYQKNGHYNGKRYHIRCVGGIATPRPLHMASLVGDVDLKARLDLHEAAGYLSMTIPQFSYWRDKLGLTPVDRIRGVPYYRLVDVQRAAKERANA